MSPKKVAVSLCIIVCGLIVAHLSSQAWKVYGGHEMLGLERQLNLNEENNIPSWYSSSTLFFCALLLGLIGTAKRRDRAPFGSRWLGLAGLFLYLSLDEAASLHEMTMPLARTLLDRAGLFTGYLFYSWVIFGIVAVAAVGIYNLPFLLNLPSETRLCCVVAGLLYVGGAIGAELFGGKVDYLGGKAGMTYAVLVAVEEGLEMFGVVIFLYALLSYINREDVGASLLRLHQRMTASHHHTSE